MKVADHFLQGSCWYFNCTRMAKYRLEIKNKEWKEEKRKIYCNISTSKLIFTDHFPLTLFCIYPMWELNNTAAHLLFEAPKPGG